jgi:carbon storage regulator
VLILHRKTHERIIIDDNIIVEILSYDGDKVRLGIIAPEEVTIDHPKKIVRAIEEPNKTSITYKTVKRFIGR